MLNVSSPGPGSHGGCLGRALLVAVAWGVLLFLGFGLIYLLRR
jgi:hypothetical protein